MVSMTHAPRQLRFSPNSITWSFVNKAIYYGIKTGCNDAFIIDSPTRDRLVSEDPRSAEILKQIVRGRDIQRYNLRNCAYHAEFSVPKLLWIELADRGRFALDETGMLAEATAFVLTGGPIKYLCAILNSELVRWFLRHSAPTSGMGTLRWKKAYLESVPVVRANAEDRSRIVRHVDHILRVKDADPCADILDIEAEIDRVVYSVYGLNAEEINGIC